MNDKIKTSISNISEDIRNDFANYAKEKNITQGQLFDELWIIYKSSNVNFNEEERIIINKAIKLFDNRYNELLKSNILKTVKKLISNVDNITDKTIRNSYYAADLRVDEIIKEMMKNNDEAVNWYDKKYLSKNTISMYAKNRKNTIKNAMSLNMKVINRYLLKHKADINNHHLKHELNENHNLKAHKYMIKMELENVKTSC